MKKLIVMILLIFAFTPSMVNANTISSINMDIFINENGNAQITETWICTTNQGTESYHPYYNLDTSRIQNLKVSDESGRTYETLTDWNTSASFSEKSYKCGLNYISNGIEICWGISKYGNKIYTVEYEITNFVSSLNDSQMAYWQLIPYEFSNTIGNVDIEIKSDFAYEDTLDVWGYGNYGGPCYVSNGIIKMSSKGKLSTDEYMVILVKFPQGTFNTSNHINQDFNYYLNLAEKGTIHYNYKIEYFKRMIEGLIECAIGIFIIAIVSVGPFCMTILLIALLTAIVDKKEQLDKFLKIPRKDIRNVKKADFYRENPCTNGILEAFYIAANYKLIRNKTDLIGAFFLKWIKEKKISIIKESGRICKRNKTSIHFEKINSKDNFEDKLEYGLYKIIYNNATNEGILTKKSLKKWCFKDNRLKKWFIALTNIEREKLNKNKLEVLYYGGFLTKYKPRDEMTAEAMQLGGLKNFLKNYSLISERESIEVELFEEYLILAQIFGISKKVIKEFKGLYPNLIEQSKFMSFENVAFIMVSLNNGINSSYFGGSVSKEFRSVSHSSSSYSDGGGGYSSGGGRRTVHLVEVEVGGGFR